MNQRRSLVSATSAEELDTVKQHVLDEEFSEGTIAFDGAREVLEIGYWTPCVESASLLRQSPIWWLWRRYRVPMRMARLEIRQAADWRIEDYDGMGEWMFADISYDSDRRAVTVSGIPPVEVIVQVRTVEVALTVDEEPSGYTVVWTPHAAHCRPPSKVHTVRDPPLARSGSVTSL